MLPQQLRCQGQPKEGLQQLQLADRRDAAERQAVIPEEKSEQHAAKVSREALQEGVVLAPGNVFSLSQTAAPYLRFNVAQCQSPRIFEVLEKAMGRV